MDDAIFALCLMLCFDPAQANFSSAQSMLRTAHAWQEARMLAIQQQEIQSAQAFEIQISLMPDIVYPAGCLMMSHW